MRYADIVVFDPETVGSEDATLVADLPGDSARLTAGSFGVTRVLVNGTVIVEHGRATGATPGTVLRVRARHADRHRPMSDARRERGRATTFATSSSTASPGSR